MADGHKPPKGVQEEAAKGLEWRREYKRGGTAVGVARARDLSNGKAVSDSTISRMVSFFARHENNKKATGWSPDEPGFPSNGRIAWALWGGDPGKSWAEKTLKQIQNEQSKRAIDMQETIERKQLPPVAESQLVMRSLVVRAEGQALRVVTATEAPVMRYDDQRGMVVAEVLEMDGIEMRAGQNQIPIVDSHNESTVRNIFGSLRNLNITGDEFGGIPYFASDPDSQAAEAKLRDGHLTDFSITAIPREVVTVDRGQQYTTPRGTVVDGPANIVTRWTPINASLVATGADERSTVRRSYQAAQTEVKRMDESLLLKLQQMGLPEGMTDPNQILAWVVGRMGSDQPEMPEPMESAMAEDPKPAEDEEKPMVENMGDKEEKMSRADATEQIKRALAGDQARRKEIVSLCTLHRIDRAFADELCDGFVSLNDARTRILERMATQPVGQTAESARVVGSEVDRAAELVGGGLVLRAYRAANIKRQAANLPPDAGEFKSLPLWRLGEVLLRAQGINTDRMSPKDVAQVAMGNRETMRRFKIERSAWHTTGSFPNLLTDAANKTLLAAYEETPATWNIWARTADPVSDFKDINRIRFSESPDPELVAERHEYPEKTMSDSKENYKVEKYGAMFSVSWETVVNDDLNAISRIPAMHGAAMRRKVNKVVYGVLTANDALSDGIALFNASHSNVSSGAGAPSTTTLDAAFNAMMTQKGLSSDTTLGIVPRYIIFPSSYSGTTLQFLNSIAPPSVGGSAVGNANVANIYGPGGDRPLIPVVEPLLDASSTTNWYLAADTSQVDTVEVTFLEGEESPVLETEWDFDTDCYKYKVRQTFAAKAIDFRGLYRNSA